MKSPKMQKTLILLRNSLLVLLVLFVVSNIFSQNKLQINNIQQKIATDSCEIYKNRDVRFIETSNKSFIAKYNPISLSLSGMMFLYQKFISQQLGSDCIYEISCSSYSKELIKDYGMIKGVFYTADRLLRCNRIAVGDIHPLKISDKSHKVMETTEIYKHHKHIK